MKKIYSVKNFLLISAAALLFFATSCKKNPPVVVNDASATKIGLYELDSSVYKNLVIAISQVGTKTVDYGAVFDTGSGGLVIDADSLLPASMITPSGFVFSGDSIVVNGITVTNQTSYIEYGADTSSFEKVYGNLAYAPVTIGEDETGTVIIRRLPFFLYYKAADEHGNVLPPHDFDTFGVSDFYDASFSNGVNVTSPFVSYDPGTGLTRGFKIAAVGTSNFSYTGTFVPNVVTLGLTASDLSSSSGFVMNTLSYYSGNGYPPFITATITYNSKAFNGLLIFDTGNPAYTYLEDDTYKGALTQLATSSTVSIVSPAGFSYTYGTTPTENLTYVENPGSSGGSVSIVSLEYFLNNEFMLDLTNHKLGLKVN